MNKHSTPKTAYDIFKSGSVTFFTASLFFPRSVRSDVFDLYAFVRVFDDFVDSVPQQTVSYWNLKKLYQEGIASAQFTDNDVVDRFIALQQRAGFRQEWVDAFFDSMEMDMRIFIYQTMQQTEHYMYGSAEVVGLMMARIMQLPDKTLPYAQLLGKAFQYMNMVRDIADDLKRGRTYIPVEVYTSYGLPDLTEASARAHPAAFVECIRMEIRRYREWRHYGTNGFPFIPRRYRLPIVAVTELFDHTMDQIERNPFVVFERQVKPSRLRALSTVLKQFV